MKYVVNGPDSGIDDFGLADIEKLETLDPGNISTFSGDLTAFCARGGKVLALHGLKDEVSFPSAIEQVS